MIANFIAVFGLSVTLASAGVVVRKTGSPPTGYEVDFTFYDPDATQVNIAGGLQTFTDQFHVSPQASASYDPHDYKPGWFRSLGLEAVTPYNMTSLGDGNWTYTSPFPSGTYLYAFVVDCFDPTNCTLANGKYVIDPDNPPFVNVPGDQISSRFQVPYDETFQYYPDIGLDFDYTLPVPEEDRGTITTVNYTSPGSIHPAPDVHDFTLYLPREYGTVPGKKYPVLYLSHGGGGNAQDWENQGYASHILDRLILDGHIEPTVVVMPSFYNIEAEYEFTPGASLLGSFPPAPVVRENYMSYLFPWVEAHYEVATEPARRAFAGLSLGGLLTFEMYVNATDYFDYFGIFSAVLLSDAPATNYINTSTVAAKPAYLEKGAYLSAGLYDFAFEDVRQIQTAMDGAGVPYRGRIAPFGFHSWNTWTDCLWNFGQNVLWQPLPLASFSALG